MNDLKQALALLRAQDVLTLHRRDGIPYDRLDQALGRAPGRSASIAALAKDGPRPQRATYKKRIPATEPGRAAPGQAAAAVTAAMRTLTGPFAAADVIEASGYAAGQVDRVIKRALADGILTEAGTRPIGKNGRNVKSYTLAEK